MLSAWSLLVGGVTECTPICVAAFLSWWLARPDRDAPGYLGAVVAINAFWFFGMLMGMMPSVVWAVCSAAQAGPV